MGCGCLNSKAQLEQMHLHLSRNVGKEVTKKVALTYQLNIISNSKVVISEISWLSLAYFFGCDCPEISIDRSWSYFCVYALYNLGIEEIFVDDLNKGRVNNTELHIFVTFSALYYNRRPLN